MWAGGGGGGESGGGGGGGGEDEGGDTADCDGDNTIIHKLNQGIKYIQNISYLVFY